MEAFSEPLSALIDDRLPVLTLRAMLADWTAGITLGLIAAMVLALLASLVLGSRPSAAKQALDVFADTQSLPKSERLLAQAKALRALAISLKIPPDADWLVVLGRKLGTDIFSVPPAVSDFRSALYRPDAALDPDALQAELTPLIKRLRL